MKRSLWYRYKVKVMSELQRRRDLSNHDLTAATLKVGRIKKLKNMGHVLKSLNLCAFQTQVWSELNIFNAELYVTFTKRTTTMG